MWTAVIPYIKKYYWVIILFFVAFTIDRLSFAVEVYQAYKHPQTKIVYITKTVKQKDVIHTKETVIKVDGTKVIREGIEDKSREVSDRDQREESKPVLSSLKSYENKLYTEYDFGKKETEVGYEGRYRMYGFGFSAYGIDLDLANQVPVSFTGGKAKVSLTF